MAHPVCFLISFTAVPRDSEIIGIGKSNAFAVEKNGISTLAHLDVNMPLLERTRDEIQAQFPHIEVEVLQVNVADQTSIETAVRTLVEKAGRIDIGVNCAGISGSPTPTHEMSLSEWQKVVDINQTGLWLCQMALIRQMLKQE